MISYLIEGFRLHQPEHGFRLMADSEFASGVTARRVNLVVPLMHGEIPAWNDPIESSTITLRVRITDADHEQLQHKWNYLRSLLLLGGNRPITLVRESPTGNTSAQVQLQSMEVPEFTYPASMVTATIMFHNPSGRWYGSEDEDQELLLSSAGQRLEVAAHSTAPITDGLIRVEGPLTSVRITNDANATGLEWRGLGPVDAGRFLLIDMRSFSAWNNPEEDWDRRSVDVSTGLVSTGNGPLTFTPVVSLEVGGNSSSVSVTSSGTSSASRLHIRARRTYA